MSLSKLVRVRCYSQSVLYIILFTQVFGYTNLKGTNLFFSTCFDLLGICRTCRDTMKSIRVASPTTAVEELKAQLQTATLQVFFALNHFVHTRAEGSKFTTLMILRNVGK